MGCSLFLHLSYQKLVAAIGKQAQVLGDVRLACIGRIPDVTPTGVQKHVTRDLKIGREMQGGIRQQDQCAGRV